MHDDCPLVLVRWQDSHQPLPGWQHLSDLDLPKTCECATVGWLLKDEPEHKVLAQSIGGLSEDDPQAGGIMLIPSCSVLSVERLEEVSASSSQTSSYPAPVSEPKHERSAAASV